MWQPESEDLAIKKPSEFLEGLILKAYLAFRFNYTNQTKISTQF